MLYYRCTLTLLLLAQSLCLINSPLTNFIRVTEGLNARFQPNGDDPFRIVTRLAEECGEVATEVNHFERQGVKVARFGEPEPPGSSPKSYRT